MTDPGILTLPLPDARARERIAGELDTSLLVEAGAGSGKTTELVSRMTALVSSGTTEIERIAAVTFTRKAAGELRQRFQMRLEERLRAERADPDADGLVAERLARALEGIDRAFLGTIHSFCARLLRERPLEVGLDPGFQELPVEERLTLRRRFWESYLERLTRDSDPILEELSSAGIRPVQLVGAFEHLVENPDVEFPAESARAPTATEIAPIRDELEAIVENGWELIPERVPDRGWDSLQSKIRTLHFTLDVTGWKEPSDLFDAVAALVKDGTSGHRITQNRWREAGLAKAFKERVDAFGVGDTPARRLLHQWLAHRYALALRLARHAVDEFGRHRMRIGKLDFQDLLVLAARLLRESPEVRRQLGERYRYLLVDEFQDTDPLQAEIVLLLTSEPEEASPREGDVGAEGAAGDRPDARATAVAVGPDWRTVVPRPGALFVVGDPKQSIYRFRRADIQLYGFVKERFADFGGVVELTSNFRSRPPIGDLVNRVFDDPGFFPREATEEQAAFEPLNTRPSPADAPAEGVFVYDVAPDGTSGAAVAGDDAARLASWIRDRVDAGEREPGDFLILTRWRPHLSIYAQALEAHSIPVQVTGAGVGAEHEIRELEVVLECMIDPTNPVKVVAALVGLFFGIDYEQLVAHRLDGGGLDVMHPRDRGHPDVLAALRALHRWWRAQTHEPADVFVSRLVTELGLLPYAAAGELGTLRAGALVYALDAVRAAALAGDASLPGALGALRAALDLTEAEAPLEPLQPNVVRLMNLHQAKGLEGTVVVLADPSRKKDHRPAAHTVRRDDGSAVGYLRVAEARPGFGGDSVLAVPVGWGEKEAAEQRFENAEEVRLTYVAVTRAKEELVVARWPEGRATSPWAPLEPWLEEHAGVLELEARPPEPRERLELAAAEARERTEEAAARLRALSSPTFTHTSVTVLTKGDVPTGERAAGAPPAPGRGYKGLSWGSAVHGALAAAALTGSTDEGLRATCRDLLVEHERPLDDHGDPTELAELLEMVRAVRASELWRRARAAERCLVEVPFATPVEEPQGEQSDATASDAVDDGRPQLDLFGSAGHDAEPEGEGAASDAEGRAERAADADDGAGGRDAPVGPARILEGVIDLAFLESDGWVVADYKTDVGTDPDFPARSSAYRRQVELYAEAWAALTGRKVKERVLFYTTLGRVESW